MELKENKFYLLFEDGFGYLPVCEQTGLLKLFDTYEEAKEWAITEGYERFAHCDWYLIKETDTDEYEETSNKLSRIDDFDC